MQAINDTIEGNESLRKIKEWVVSNPARAGIVAVVAIAVVIAIIVIIVLAAGNRGGDNGTMGNGTMISSSPTHYPNITRSPYTALSHTASHLANYSYSYSYTPSPSNHSSNYSYSPTSSPGMYNTTTNNNNNTGSNTNPFSHDYSSPCNGRGLLFPDSAGICECFLNCWYGASCQYYNNSGNCTIYAKNEESVGIFEDYWVSRANYFTAPFIPADYRIPYQADLRILSPSSPNGLSRNLWSAIRYLHSVVGNANITGRSIILGTGRNSLIQATLASLYRRWNNSSVTLFSRAPYNRDYPKICTYTQHLCDFSSDVNSVQNSSYVFELLTVPNIPTGRTDTNVTSLTFPSNQFWGIDANDNWPTWTVNSTANGTIYNNSVAMLNAPIVYFSSSKSHGFESGRFAWALVNTALVPGLIEGMRDYISTLYVHASVDTMYREYYTLQSLNQTLNASGSTAEIWNVTSSVVKSRWNQVQAMFNTSSVVAQGWSVDSAPGSCYLWIRCPSSMSASACQQAFESKGLVGYPGSDFGMSGTTGVAYYRLSISVRSVVWPLFTNVLAQVLGISTSSS